MYLLRKHNGSNLTRIINLKHKISENNSNFKIYIYIDICTQFHVSKTKVIYIDQCKLHTKIL